MNTQPICLGHTSTLADLSPQALNGFLAWLRELGRKPKTIKLRRNSLLTLWRWAYEELLTDQAPRAKRVVLKPSVPQFWTPKQLLRLVRTMAEDQKPMSNEIPRGLWFSSLSVSLYSTGLRLSDLLAARRDEVAGDGSYSVIQQKTGRLITRTIDPRALVAILGAGSQDRVFIWDLPYKRDVDSGEPQGVSGDQQPPRSVLRRD